MTGGFDRGCLLTRVSSFKLGEPYGPELPIQCHPDVSVGADAAASAVVTPKAGTGVCATHVVCLAHRDSRDVASEPPTDGGKKFAAYWAHSAQKAYSVHQRAAGYEPVRLSINRWGVAQVLHDVAELVLFLTKVRGAHA